MPATIWSPEFDEAEAVADLLVAFRDWHGRDWPSANAYIASVERLMERGEAQFLLGAPHEDAPPAAVAQIRYRFSVWTAAEDATLEDLYVTDAARGSGLGGAMLDAVIAAATERGCRRIELDTAEDNAPALRLYARGGFTSGAGEPGRRQLLLRRPLGD